MRKQYRQCCIALASIAKSFVSCSSATEDNGGVNLLQRLLCSTSSLVHGREVIWVPAWPLQPVCGYSPAKYCPIWQDKPCFVGH